MDLNEAQVFGWFAAFPVYIKDIHGVLLVQTINYHRDVLVSRHQKEKQGYQGHNDFCTSLHQVSQLSGKNRLQMVMS